MRVYVYSRLFRIRLPALIIALHRRVFLGHFVRCLAIILGGQYAFDIIHSEREM